MRSLSPFFTSLLSFFSCISFIFSLKIKYSFSTSHICLSESIRCFITSRDTRSPKWFFLPQHLRVWDWHREIVLSLLHIRRQVNRNLKQSRTKIASNVIMILTRKLSIFIKSLLTCKSQINDVKKTHDITKDPAGHKSQLVANLKGHIKKNIYVI